MQTSVIRRLLTETETAVYLGVSRSFLAKGRMNGRRENHMPTPPYVKVGGGIRYDIGDLDAWISEHKVAS